MQAYLMIESRDPFESNDVGHYFELARGLVQAGNHVTLFLTQNAVLAARPSAQVPTLRTLIVSGVSVEADDFALRERGITKVLDGVKVVSIDKVVDHMESGHKTLWH
jgi:sulfur transfer complex TusBCD TusB component (DsrH family)